MNENEKDEIIDDTNEELEESIETFVSELEELTEEEKDPKPDEETEDEEDLDESSDYEEAPDTAEDEEENNSDPEEEPAPETAPAETEADKKYKAIIRQGRKTLRSLGVEVKSDDDVLIELQRIAAETEGKSLEEYQKEQATEEANDLSNEAVYARDLAAIQKEYPATKNYKHLKELPNLKRFVELMQTGKMSAVEAFELSHPQQAKDQIVKSVKQSSLNDTKSHLKSTIPKKSGGKREISNSEMREYRDMFPDLSDKEIEKLCRRVSN